MRPKQREAVLWKVVLLQLKWNKGFCWDDMGNWEWLQPSCKKGKPAPLLRQVLELLLGSGWLSVAWGEVRQQWSSAAKCWLPVLSAASPAAVWPHRKPGRGTSVVLQQCSICDTQRSNPTPVTHRGVVSNCKQELLDTVGQLLWPAPPHLRCSNVFPVTTRWVATKASTRLGLTFLRDNVTKAHFWLWSVGAGGHSVTCRRKERVQLVDNHDQWPTIDHRSGSVDREPRCKEDLCLIIARDPSEKSNPWDGLLASLVTS